MYNLMKTLTVEYFGQHHRLLHIYLICKCLNLSVDDVKDCN